MNYIDDLATRVEAALPSQSRPRERAESLYRLYALLALTTGEQTSLRNVHDAWSIWMLDVDPEHDSLVPFEQLTPEVRDEDQVFRDAIVSVARHIKG